jgi:amino acid transporter
VLFRGHWKALSDYRSGELLPDRWTRRILVIVPLGVAGLMFWPGATLAAPGALLSGVALLAGSFLAAWGQVASMRMKLTDRASEYRNVEQFDRDALDETAAHLLVASLLSGATALMLVLGMNFAADATTGAVSGVFAALAAGLATYVLIVFLIAVPRLYTAYANLHQVRDELSGTHKSRP